MSQESATASTFKKLGYLGPANSYTHAALCTNYHCTTAEAFPSITRIFDALAAGKIDWGFVPLENMLAGPVSETLDCLLAHAGNIQIRESRNFSIEHCLGRIKGADATPITAVYSHPQALSQCAEYLDTHFPNAQRISCASTAAAALQVAKEATASSAAIASAEALADHGLLVHAEHIAKQNTNKTRFALLSRQNHTHPHESFSTSSLQVTSIALDPSRDRQGILHEVLEVLSHQHRCNLLSIHSRPDQRGGFVFFLDLEGGRDEPQVAAALAGLELYCREQTGGTAVLTCFGSYPYDAFHSLPFQRIGIIGAKGVMGRWFSHFFSSLGFQTQGVDKEDIDTLPQLVAECDALLLSVPMREIAPLANSLASLVRPGQLVIENSSIKHPSLPVLEQLLPKDVEVLGIHTMFGPRATNIRGENIIITKTASSGSIAQAFEDLLYKQGAVLSYASPELHDKASATLQALVHLLLIATSEVLEEQWGTEDALRPFTTPNARPLLTAMQRVLEQPDELLEDMQLLNVQSERQRHSILEKLCHLVFSIDAGENEALRKALQHGRAFFNSK